MENNSTKTRLGVFVAQSLENVQKFIRTNGESNSKHIFAIRIDKQSFCPADTAR